MAEEFPQPITLPPGIAAHSTTLSNEGRYVDEAMMRSVNRVHETIGGWAQIDGTPQLMGICRGIELWGTLDSHRLAAFGTHRKLYAYDQGQEYDITPLRESGTLGSDPFTMVSGSAVVTVDHTAHGLIDGAFATFGSADPAGGITIDGTYEVTRIDVDSYEITHSSAATSSTSGGGASVSYAYELNPGYESSAFAFGYGVGGYGAGFYGTPRTNTLGVLLDGRTWTLADSGEDLIACPRDGSIYLWDYSAGFSTRAALLSNAPTPNAAVFVTPERAVVAVGAGGNPMDVEWCDIDDRTVWTPGAANTAGGVSLQGGNRLLNGKSLRGGINLIWSDADVFRMLWLGQDPYYGFRKEASGAGLAGPHAGIEHDGKAYWWAPDDNFYLYDGFVRPLPNQDNIREIVFEDVTTQIDRNQKIKVFAFRNIAHREIWWLYQSVTSQGDCDRYVMFDIDENEFHIGPMERTAWLTEPIFPYPIATDADGLVYEHEMGTDAESAALRKHLETSPFDLGDGEEHMDVKGFYCDFAGQVGDITMTVKTRDDSREAWRTEVVVLTPTDGLVDLRSEGRQAALAWESNEVGGKFKMGRPTLLLAASGKRRGR